MGFIKRLLGGARYPTPLPDVAAEERHASAEEHGDALVELDIVGEDLGDDAFAAAFDEGRAFDDDSAVAYAARARGERRRPRAGWDSLIPTEEEVVRLTVEGLSNKEIGARLLMSPETVKTHLSHVYDKVGLRTRTALAREAVLRSGPRQGR